MSNNYFPGQGLVNFLFTTQETQYNSPEPEPQQNPNVVYAEPLYENNEYSNENAQLKNKIKSLEDEIRKLKHENENLKARITVENKIEKIYENSPSLEKIEEMVLNLAEKIRN